MKSSLIKLSAALAAILVQQAAFAGTVNEALALYDAARYADAARVLRTVPEPSGRAKGMLCELYVRSVIPDEAGEAQQACSAAAAAHDPHGLLILATAHSQANPPAGIAHNETAALRYLAEAVELDFPPAFDAFCEYFYRKNMFTEATPFCKVAAASKLPESMFRMAQMLFEGKGAVQNFEKGRAFALASARMNYAPAYAMLGDQARDGKMGVAKDSVQAYSWYSLAASAAPDWKEPVNARDGLQLTDEQVAAAQKVAGAWTTQSQPRSRDFYRTK